jgi:DNA-binding NtrC family response regulator
MVEKQGINIAIFDYDPVIAKKIVKALNEMGFFDVQLATSLSNLLSFFEESIYTTPQVVILDLVDIDMSFANHSSSGLNLIEKIKTNYEDVSVICINIETGEKNDIPIKALINGCDSLIDKKEENYLDAIVDAVNHWAQYTIEKNKLSVMYDSILSYCGEGKLKLGLTTIETQNTKA